MLHCFNKTQINLQVITEKYRIIIMVAFAAPMTTRCAALVLSLYT